MALDVFNLRKARWEPSGSSVTLLWFVVPERKMFVVWCGLHAWFEETGRLDMWLGKGRECFWESEGNCVRRECNNFWANHKEIQLENVALAALHNNSVGPSGDLYIEYCVRSYCVRNLHVDSVCGEVMGMCSVPEVRFSRRRQHTNIASSHDLPASTGLVNFNL